MERWGENMNKQGCGIVGSPLRNFLSSRFKIDLMIIFNGSLIRGWVDVSTPVEKLNGLNQTQRK